MLGNSGFASRLVRFVVAGAVIDARGWELLLWEGGCTGIRLSCGDGSGSGCDVLVSIFWFGLYVLL
jgi:hypothetical protein